MQGYKTLASIDDLKKIVGKPFQNMITFLAALCVVGGIYFAADTFINTRINTLITVARNTPDFNVKVTEIAKATWAEALVKANTEHREYENTLTSHGQRLEALEKQGNEVNRKLDVIIEKVQNLKEELPRRK